VLEVPEEFTSGPKRQGHLFRSTSWPGTGLTEGQSSFAGRRGGGRQQLGIVHHSLKLLRDLSGGARALEKKGGRSAIKRAQRSKGQGALWAYSSSMGAFRALSRDFGERSLGGIADGSARDSAPKDPARDGYATILPQGLRLCPPTQLSPQRPRGEGPGDAPVGLTFGQEGRQSSLKIDGDSPASSTLIPGRQAGAALPRQGEIRDVEECELQLGSCGPCTCWGKEIKVHDDSARGGQPKTWSTSRTGGLQNWQET